MPPTSSDRRLLLVTGSFLLVAAVFFGGVIWLATSRKVEVKGPLYLGPERALKSHIHEGSPLYLPNPRAGDGFWLDIEGGHLVALVLVRPGTKHCVVKWKDQQDAYIDCNDKPLQSRDLDHYEVTVGSRNGSPNKSVYVDLRAVTPAPG